MSELPYFPDGSTFLTWTYDDENLPEDGGLNKKHMQNAFKRLRKGLTFKIKHFTVGEYGDESFRPHYHSICLGLPHRYIRDNNLFGSKIPETSGRKFTIYKGSNVWPYGSVTVGTVTRDSIVYVTGYIRKKLNGDLGKERYGDLQPPFQLQSQGLGLKWAEDNAEYLQQRLLVTVQGKKMAIPRYFKKKIWLDDKKLRELALKSEHDFYQMLDERGLYAHEIYQQREKTLNAMVNLKKGKL